LTFNNLITLIMLWIMLYKLLTYIGIILLSLLLVYVNLWLVLLSTGTS